MEETSRKAHEKELRMMRLAEEGSDDERWDLSELIQC